MGRITAVISLVLFATIFTGAIFPVAAQPADPFFKGKQIKLIVGSNAGGNYDQYGRFLARYMGRHLPGNPSFVVQNMPAGGGILAANFLYNLAPKDGLTLAHLQRTIPQAAIVGLPGTEYDATKFNWLGSLNNEVTVCVAWHESSVKTLQDVMSRELIIGSQGQTDGDQFPAVLNTVIGTKFKMVSGYTGGSEMLLAMERREVEGRCGWSWSSIQTQRPAWLSENKINILVQTSLQKHPDLPNVPLAMDFVKTPEDRQALEFLFGRNVVGRVFAAPPGLPADRVADLRAAFEAVTKDPEAIADADKQKLKLTPVSAAEVQALIERFHRTPKQVIDAVEKAGER